ncbi:uncharacterized protein LOC106696946 [Myotis lucifugus]|uniref:uncharacterized protein LOC106696946 n=1 Tax=Myotis lucifugus TaxID=59463 RepID=UPI000CCC4B19|nr:uncharacterized protein LOC106696946 [Myotis lucifugus]
MIFHKQLRMFMMRRTRRRPRRTPTPLRPPLRLRFAASGAKAAQGGRARAGGGAPRAGGAGREGAGGVAPQRGPAGTNSRRGWSSARAGGGVLLVPEDPASPPFPGAAAAFSARSPWILRFTRVPAGARRSGDSPHPSSLPEAEPGPPKPKFGWRAIGALRRQDGRHGSGAAGAQWLPAQGKTHRSHREEQTLELSASGLGEAPLRVGRFCGTPHTGVSSTSRRKRLLPSITPDHSPLPAPPTRDYVVGARLSTRWPDGPCSVETRASSGAYRLSFVGRGLRAQETVKTARLPNRPTWGPASQRPG